MEIIVTLTRFDNRLKENFARRVNDFLRLCEPYDVVVDLLNVYFAKYHKNTTTSGRKGAADAYVNRVIDELLAAGLRVLVVGRHHVKNHWSCWSRIQIECQTLLLDNRCNL